MCNAPATFQCLINTVLCDLDDIIVYASTWEEDTEVLKQVFMYLAAASFTLNLNVSLAKPQSPIREKTSRSRSNEATWGQDVFYC